jgi:hypothetical protein
MYSFLSLGDEANSQPEKVKLENIVLMAIRVAFKFSVHVSVFSRESLKKVLHQLVTREPLEKKKFAIHVYQ